MRVFVLVVDVVLDVAAVEVGQAFGRAQRDVDQEGLDLPLVLRLLGHELARDRGDLRVGREDQIEVGVRAAVGLHHVEHDLIDAVLAQEAIDRGHVRQVALGDDRAGVQLDPVALEAGDHVDAGQGLFEAVGRAREPFVQLLGVAVDRHVEAVHAERHQALGELLVSDRPTVGHHRDAASARVLGHLHPVVEAWIGGRLARGEADLFEALVLREDPTNGLVGGLRVGHVALLAILLHAEHTVVVAHRSGQNVHARGSTRDPLDDVLDRRLGFGPFGPFVGLGDLAIEGHAADSKKARADAASCVRSVRPRP